MFTGWSMPGTIECLAGIRATIGGSMRSGRRCKRRTPCNTPPCNIPPCNIPPRNIPTCNMQHPRTRRRKIAAVAMPCKTCGMPHDVAYSHVARSLLHAINCAPCVLLHRMSHSECILHRVRFMAYIPERALHDARLRRFGRIAHYSCALRHTVPSVRPSCDTNPMGSV
jgi:hypothetical protein